MEDPLAFISTGYGTPYHDTKSRWWKPEELESAVGFGPDAFHVDDLLEFSNEVIGGPIGGLQVSGHSIESSVTFADAMSHQSATKGKQQPSRLNDEEQHAKDLGLDYNEIAELDWLSKFVEESYSTGEHMKDYVSKELLSVAASDKRPEMSTTQDPFARTSPLAISESSATSARSTPLSWEMSVPGRARSKRCRSGSRVWSSSILTSDSQGNMEAHSSVHDMPLFAESFLSFDYSALSADSEFILTEEDSAEIPPANKYLKPCKGRKLGQNGAAPRRCTHCLSQHTPQWRAGPAGPKTLCNACGVRYKSGRLLPEYRPAGSPTFMAHIHSNSHRKVVEMRRQKEQKEIKLPHQDEFEFDSRTDDLFQT